MHPQYYYMSWDLAFAGLVLLAFIPVLFIYGRDRED